MSIYNFFTFHMHTPYTYSIHIHDHEPEAPPLGHAHSIIMLDIQWSIEVYEIAKCIVNVNTDCLAETVFRRFVEGL